MQLSAVCVCVVHRYIRSTLCSTFIRMWFASISHFISSNVYCIFFCLSLCYARRFPRNRTPYELCTRWLSSFCLPPLSFWTLLSAVSVHLFLTKGNRRKQRDGVVKQSGKAAEKRKRENNDGERERENKAIAGEWNMSTNRKYRSPCIKMLGITHCSRRFTSSVW